MKHIDYYLDIIQKKKSSSAGGGGITPVGTKTITTNGKHDVPLWNLCDEATVTAIVGTITAVATCLGTLLGVSTMKYRKSK